MSDLEQVKKLGAAVKVLRLEIEGWRTQNYDTSDRLLWAVDDLTKAIDKWCDILEKKV